MSVNKNLQSNIGKELGINMWVDLTEDERNEVIMDECDSKVLDHYECVH